MLVAPGNRSDRAKLGVGLESALGIYDNYIKISEKRRKFI
jgi:hypothetical protein